jgi:hypothetical protein
MTSPPDTIDYAAVLKDLEARKAVLEAMIANTRQMLGLGVSVGATPSTQAAPEAEDMRGHPFLGMSIGEAAKKYLSMVKQKQNVKQIAEALERGGLHHVSNNFPATVATMVNRYAKSDPDLLNIGRGEWALAAWYGNRRPKPVEPPKKRKGKRVAKQPARQKEGAGAKADTPPPSARQLTEVVLGAAGEPLNIDEIAKRIEALPNGRKIDKATIASMFTGYVKKNHVFTRTAPGMYALAEK